MGLFVANWYAADYPMLYVLSTVEPQLVVCRRDKNSGCLKHGAREWDKGGKSMSQNQLLSEGGSKRWCPRGRVEGQVSGGPGLAEGNCFGWDETDGGEQER